MIIFIFAGLVFLYIFFTALKDDSWSESLFFAFCASIIAFLAAFVPVLLASLFLYPLDEPMYEGSSTIVSIADGSEAQGRFFLFGGTVDSVNYYYFYRETSDGGVRQAAVPVSEATIYETNEDTPHFDKFDCRMEMEFWGFSGFGCGAPYYHFYIPEGSVTNKFSLDLEN